MRLLFEVLVCLSRLLAAIFAKEKRSREQAHLIHEPVLGIPKKALVRDYRAALLRDWPAGGCFLSDNRKASQSSPIHGMQQFEYPVPNIMKTYTYLAFAKLEGAWQFCLDTSAKTACGNQVGPISTAKWSGNGGLLSVFDRDNPPVALKIPLLRERIIDASTSATWLGNLISEDRQLDDLGGGGGAFDCKPKWLDIYVEYVPKSSRPSEYQGHTMVGILGGGNDPMKWEEQLPRLNNLRVEWAE